MMKLESYTSNKLKFQRKKSGFYNFWWYKIVFSNGKFLDGKYLK